ncbi:multi-sensor signal transduction multi-kinase [[Leptolyngbya] sp. PCC 7376]|uniref:AAA family ATPase n=1 Tax=[Leptolyngbya] sp. PCC 7376 TaxID=111781 RepID=UPI00029F037C|nr:AAA family ATPase [[Leptolyngbya] sp. PCC 7376]AFY38978.1 multi-sensor signal transduction multi-kinase [[Leptolyngbya] sp. PCC 7376]
MTSSTNPATSLSLPGYTLGEMLYQGDRTIVYRATEIETKKPVIIKVLSNPYPTFNELVQFRNQYTITKNLNISGIVQPLDLVSWGNGYALIMEDLGSLSLHLYEKQYSLVLAEVLEIAIQLADILHALHQENVIHKDIKPANILIHPESKQVKLIDFSIASLLPKETQSIQSPKGLEGTLAYLAPEQTGRMNRAIDYRADFYALGVTLYQLLTGTLPFTSDDPMELIHSHIALLPTAVDQVKPQVPSTVARMVEKLMQKNAEDRYQSALGLKHDLEVCLSQWQDSQEINEFELGQRDLGDRFLIPEKLYGRDSEVQTLLDAFDRVAKGSSEMVLVSGLSGIGKTAVINEVQKPIAKKRGYFIKGKFDQFNRNIPFSAFVQAFRQLIGQLLGESDAELQAWQRKILATLGDNGQILVDAIPELEKVIGAQPDAPELSSTAAQNRFNLLFQKFIALFTTANHPLTLFLDDLQWADSASLNLIRILMGEGDRKYLLLLGAYRNNEVYPAHPLMLMLRELEKEQNSISTITLTPLPISDANCLVAETLNCASSLAQPLTELVYQKTQGNPFFTTQFLKGLYQDGLIAFDIDLGYWACDLARVREATLTDNVVEFMGDRLQRLPQETQDILKSAACIGNQFDLKTLAIICGTSSEDIASHLWNALRAGVILPQSEAYKFFQEWAQDEEKTDDVSVDYRFLHDRIQQAAYQLIPATQKQQVHRQIGQRLLKSNSNLQESPRIFDIANHLNQAQDLLKTAAERWQLVRLNLQAGQAARAGTAYQAAFDYLAEGLTLLSDQCWEADYPLTLALYQEGAIAAGLVGEFEYLDQWSGVALKHTPNLLDRIPFYEAQIQALVAQKQLPEAIQLGISTLEKLGLSFPQTPQPEDFPQGIAAITQQVGERDIEDLLRLTSMKDPQSLAILRILWRLSAVLVLAAPQLMPFCMFQAVELSITTGNSVLSAPVYTTYGMILCGAVGDVSTGYRFGQLGLQLVEQYPEGKALKPKTLVRFNAGVRHWQDPLHDTLESLAEGYQLALEVGDLESAAICAEVYGYHAYFAGQELTQLESVLKTYSQGIQRIQQQTMLIWNEACRQQVLNLLGQSDKPCSLMGEAYDETVNLPLQRTYKDGFGLGMVHLHKAMACYIFERSTEAIEHLTTAAQFLPSFASFASAPVFHFYTALAQVAVYPTAQDTLAIDFSESFEKSYKKLQAFARHAPTNHQHKLALVKAERYRVLGQRHDAVDAYHRAIAAAKANEYIQEEALANERFAKFYLDLGWEKEAAVYMQEAYYCYAQWGAKAKTDALEASYPNLLQPILQQRHQPLNLLENLRSITRPQLSIHASKTASYSSTMGLNQSLDLLSILKTSQALSKLLDFEELLTTLITIILQNSGGDRCALILQNQDKTWELRAIGTPAKIQIYHLPMDDHPELPCKLIQYVKNTKEVITIDGLETDLPLVDDYLQVHQPQSIVCSPILYHKQLKGVLYVSNQSARGVFGSDRLSILDFICTQAAISLENSRLFEQQKQAEARLQQNNAFLEAQRESSFNGILVTDTSRQISAFNQRFLDIWRIPSEISQTKEEDQLLRFVLSQLVAPQEFLDKVNYLYQESEVVGYDEISLKDGRILERISNPVRLSSGEYCGRIWSFQDISDRKRLEQDQRRLNSILEASSDYIALADAQGQLIWLNQEFRTLFPERTPETVQNFTIPDLHPQWVNDIIFKTGLPIAIERGTWLEELAVLNAAGEEIPVSLLIIAHKSEQGEVKYFSAIMRNISQQKQNQQALIEKSQALEAALQDLTQAQLQIVQSEKMSALGNLVAGIAHEINNPVGCIVGNVGAAQDYIEDLLSLIDLYAQEFPNPGEFIEEHLEEIDLEFVREDLPKLIRAMKDGGDRIKSISRSLRVFSRADTETKQRFNLHEGLDSTVLILRHRLKANGQRPAIEVVTEYGDIPEVACFPGQLNQVFMNILANAIDVFDEENQGKSYQEIEQSPNQITIQTSVVNGQVQIQIKDNGNGMEAQTIERIFEQGFTTKEVGKGTGLGMAIAHQIVVETHGGSLEAQSEIGQGSTFCIRLPL